MNRLSWLGAVVALALGVVAVGTAFGPAPVNAAPVAGARAGAPDSSNRRSGYGVDPLARSVIAKDLFRFGRQPAATLYDPVRGTAPLPQPTPPPAAPPKPVLSLVGIVDGAEAQAIVEGLPGVNGARAVRVGDVIGALTVQEISGGAVRIAGLDTTWVLRVREPWKQ